MTVITRRLGYKFFDHVRVLEVDPEEVQKALNKGETARYEAPIHQFALRTPME